MKSLKYLTLSILSLSIASVGYAAYDEVKAAKADFTSAEQLKTSFIKNKPPKKKLIERAIKKRFCDMPGSCHQGTNPGPSASKK